MTLSDRQRAALHLRHARAKHDPSNVKMHVEALEELREKALNAPLLSERRKAAHTYKAMTGHSP